MAVARVHCSERTSVISAAGALGIVHPAYHHYKNRNKNYKENQHAEFLCECVVLHLCPLIQLHIHLGADCVSNLEHSPAQSSTEVAAAEIGKYCVV